MRNCFGENPSALPKVKVQEYSISVGCFHEIATNHLNTLSKMLSYLPENVLVICNYVTAIEGGNIVSYSFTLSAQLVSIAKFSSAQAVPTFFLFICTLYIIIHLLQDLSVHTYMYVHVYTHNRV